MQEGRTVFAQLMDHVPRYEFGKCVSRYDGDKHIRKLSCYTQFQIMSFAQLTYRESLRDIETCLKALGGKLYHTGIRRHIPRSTLADANENRDWRIFSDFAHILIGQAVELYAGEPFGADLKSAAYVLDSTTIDLCLSLFPWAKFRRAKGAVKMHTLLTLQGNFPTLVIITPGSTHDVNILDELMFEPGAFYIVDRAYTDFSRLHRIQRASAYFVTRAKDNFRFRRRYSATADKTIGIRFDQTVVMTGFYSRQDYPDILRRIGFADPETGKTLIFLTNNMTEPAITITQLYRCRWQVELFFKWMKQHLRIKSFYGTSSNAVKVQIWIAISVYVIIAILRKRLNLTQSPYTILQILSITLFEKTPISQVLSQFPPDIQEVGVDNQLCFQGI
jgi:Domain of unknown function (DUF4372)/Transposase DDE domain